MLANPKTATELSKTADSEKSEHVGLALYPAYCYSISPTWFTWVKLTAHDIHSHLRAHHGFWTAPGLGSATNEYTARRTPLLFYLNHPIQFVQLVGTVVSVEDHFENFWLFTVDDSSGATIDVHCKRPERKPVKHMESNLQANENLEEEDDDAKARCDAMAKIDIGAVVQVKGRISTFRNVRQLRLDRISFLAETNQETRLIRARTDFYQKVLSEPWELTHDMQKRLRERALGENDEIDERARKLQTQRLRKAEREKRHARKVIKAYESQENKRHIYAQEAKRAGELLK